MEVSQVIGPLATVALALITSGALVQFLTVRANRRKIVGDASVQEANALSTLSGVALQMVEDARLSAAKAEAKAVQAVADRDAAIAAQERMWRETNDSRWEVYYLRVREAVLEKVIRESGLVIPALPFKVESPPPSFPPPTDIPDELKPPKT